VKVSTWSSKGLPTAGIKLSSGNYSTAKKNCFDVSGDGTQRISGLVACMTVYRVILGENLRDRKRAILRLELHPGTEKITEHFSRGSELLFNTIISSTCHPCYSSFDWFAGLWQLFFVKTDCY
jgi:hypothetical protein